MTVGNVLWHAVIETIAFGHFPRNLEFEFRKFSFGSLSSK